MSMKKQNKRGGTPYKRFKPTQRPPYKATTPAGIISLPVELKFNDSAIAGDATTTGVIVQLNSIAQGDTALTRDGNKIIQRSLYLRVAYDLEALTQAATIRFMVVLDKQANVAAATIAASGTGPLEAITIESQRRINTVSRFLMLCDETVTLNQPSGTGGALAKGFWEKFIQIPKTGQLASYLDGSAGIPMSNALALMYFSDVAAGAADVNVVGTARLRFTG